MRRATVLVLCLLLVVVAAPGPAYAHGLLAVSTPAHGATVTEPVDAVTLAFTEQPPEFAFFSVTAPGGVRLDGTWSHAGPVQLAKPVQEYQLVDGVWTPQDFRTGFQVRVPVAHWPEHGEYVVRYQSVASDGDKVKGEIRFTYRGPVVPAAPGWQAPVNEPGTELLGAAGQPRASASAPAAPAPAPVAAAARDRSPWLWLVPVLLVVAAAGLYGLWRTGTHAPRRRD